MISIRPSFAKGQAVGDQFAIEQPKDADAGLFLSRWLWRMSLCGHLVSRRVLHDHTLRSKRELREALPIAQAAHVPR